MRAVRRGPEGVADGSYFARRPQRSTHL